MDYFWNVFRPSQKYRQWLEYIYHYLHGVLIVKILNKYSLSIFLYNLLLDRHRNISIHRCRSCLYEIEIQIFKEYGSLIGRNNSLGNKLSQQ